ncbi:hypothetical protein BGW38_002644 [Lunasporangiospora selenospora]|uniref:DUF6589 domain-containing protein n=1 Tax=Lunasporangiospora selenospora TaxID=979761 RepID=A0A9P6FRS5_9FUNG|nr:hypothetical protein BGW38_002644 [Lunasporangiospora selenospora]
MHSSPLDIKFLDDQPQGTTDDRLLRVFQCIQDNEYTLQTFLSDACSSNDEKIKCRVKTFYSKGGAFNVLSLLMERIPEMEDHPKMYDIAVKVVKKAVDKDLNALGGVADFRRPASKVTHETIENTSLKWISTIVDLNASRFSKLLRGFLGTDGSQSSARLLPVISSMILYSRNYQSNYLQSIIGIYLFSTRCPSSVVTLLQRMGLSTSRWTVKESLRSLTRQAIGKIRQATKDEPFGLLYDNLNIANRKHDQRLTNKDSFENGTTATIIPGLNLGGIGNDSNSSLTIHDLVPDKDEVKHIHHVAECHLIGVLQRTYNSLSIDSRVRSVRKLAVAKTQTLPLPTMKIDQSTLEGNKRIIDTVMRDTIGLPEDYFEDHDIAILGDQMTNSRVTGLRHALEKDLTRYKRFEWAIPVIQLFHTQMMFAGLILRTHYGQENDPGSLGYNRVLLERKRISVDKLIFHDVDDFLRHSFDATVLRLWEVALGLEGGMNMETMLQTISADERRTLILSKSKDLVSICLDPDQQSCAADRNAALFMRDMIYYIELAAAIKNGDVGRIEMVLRWLTIMTQAGSTTNYAYELLKLQFRKKNWGKERNEMIARSWLVNTKGVEDGFIPADLYQEHCNKTIKEIYASKGSNANWEMLTDLVSINIETFRVVKSRLEKEFGMPDYDSKHQSVSATKDINSIVEVLREHDIFGRNGSTPDSHNGGKCTVDLIKDGLNNLITLKLLKFNNSKK